MWLLFNGDYADPQFDLLYTSMSGVDEYHYDDVVASASSTIPPLEAKLISWCKSRDYKDFKQWHSNGGIMRVLMGVSWVKALDDFQRALMVGQQESIHAHQAEDAPQSAENGLLEQSRGVVDEALK
jgi:hypothetical protein